MTDALRQILRSFERTLQSDGVTMPDELWALGYRAWLALQTVDQVAFGQSQVLRDGLDRDMSNFVNAHSPWLRSAERAAMTRR